LTLRTRAPIEEQDPSSADRLATSIAADGAYAYLGAGVTAEFPGTRTCDLGIVPDRVEKHAVELPDVVISEDLATTAQGPWVSALVDTGRELRAFLVDAAEGRVRAEVALEGARRGSVRLRHGAWVVADERGRVVVRGLAYGELLADVRT
jgi:hypothetical protein